jgi:hypothetical protein
MLKKTREILATCQTGMYVPDDVTCFDEEEIAEFGRILASLVYAPSKLRRKLQEYGVTITRSDHYSEIPTIADVEASFTRQQQLKLNHIFDAPFLKRFLLELIPFAEEFDPPVDPISDYSYGWKSCDGIFSYSDAMSYYCMIRKFQPETIIEIGSGASTLIASMACERNGRGNVIAIEPFPRAFLHHLPRVELITTKAQDLSDDLINGKLKDGDFLFIDSTHTVKHDSDCLHIYLRILPHISNKILVHSHDIYLPNSLPLKHLRDQQIFWTEQYLLYAYLIGNPHTKILYGSAYHHEANNDILTQFMFGRFGCGGASLWFSQDGPVR